MPPEPATDLALLWRALATIAIFLVLRIALTQLIRRGGAASGQDQDRVRGVLAMVRRGLFIFFAATLVLVLGVWDNIAVYLGSLMAVLGVALFAHWSLLSNITAGIVLFSARDLRHGDRIRIVDGDNSIEGRIIEFRMFFLVVRRDDGFRVVCPNSLVAQKAVVCMSHSTETEPVEVRAGRQSLPPIQPS